MLKIGKQTKLAPEEIMSHASRFFGKGGQGLEENEQHSCFPCRITFEGYGGYVTIFINDEEKHRMVDVETREFEYQAKQFLNKI